MTAFTTSIARETITDRRQQHMSWGAVFAGATLAVGIWILLQSLGMGLGLTAVDTDNSGSLHSASIGTGIGSIIAPLIAMFLGAMLTGRLSGSYNRKIGALHGGVTWAVATIFGLWVVMSLVGTLVGGATRIGGAAVTGTAAMVSGAAQAGASADAGDVLSALGIDDNDLLAGINQRLQRDGKPPITERQVKSTVQAVAQRGVREGKLDREVLVSELAKNTALSRADAEDVANDFTSRYGDFATRVQNSVNQIGEQAKHAALKTVDTTGKVLLYGALMMVLSLGAAMGGAALGVHYSWTPREVDRAVVSTSEVPPPV